MSAGIVLGYLLRKSRFLAFSGKAVTVVICIMLFVLGAETGADKDFLGNLSKLGLYAVVFAIAGIAGSVSGAVVVQKFLSARKSDTGKTA